MSEVEVRYRYRLRVGHAQQRLLDDVFISCRFVWNQALGRWTDLWRHEGVGFGYGDADRELTDWRGRFECCGAIAKPRIELSDRVFSCRCCGLVCGRDRNAARNLNPDRHGVPAGGTETAGAAVPVGDDGSKPKVPAGTLAA